MPLKDSQVEEFKEVFNLYDEEGDGKIDAHDIGKVIRALGLKPTNEMIKKANGDKEFKKAEKRITFEEFVPVYEAVSKEKDVGSYADFLEGLKVFDKDETGKIMAAELRHILLALGERLAADEVDEIMDGVDDGEGMVNYDAFIKKVMAGPFPEEK